MTIDELALWDKIKTFSLDKPNTKLTFSKRLARENNFTEKFSELVIEEYKKFIFLCCVSKQQITPSHFVDLAWHLHLTYTHSYWIDLCKNTLNKEIHHTPTQGGKSENQKFEHFHKETLDIYEYYFNQIPTEAIWQNTKERFENKIINIDVSKNWIVKKPTFQFLKTNSHFLFPAFVTILLFIGCNQSESTTTNPFNIIVIFVAIIIIVINLFKSINQNRSSNSSGCSSSGCGSSSGENKNGSSKDDNDWGGDEDSSSDDSSGDSGCSGCGGGGD
jgi:hypothetical protein